MPLRITVVYDILRHGGICHSGDSRMSGPLYTVATEISNTLCQMIWSSTTLGNVLFVTLLHTEGACIVTGSFTILSRPSFDFHLPQCTKACSFSSCHGGRCHCGHEMSHAIDIQSGIFSLCTALHILMVKKKLMFAHTWYWILTKTFLLTLIR